MDIVYVMYPTIDGIVTDGPAYPASYADSSQEEARSHTLRANPKATGTARAMYGAPVGTGSEAGADLDVEVPRSA